MASHAGIVPRRSSAIADNSDVRDCEKPRQLPLEWSVRDQANQAWEQTAPLLKNIVDKKTLKEFAYAVDEQPSVVSHSLAERYSHSPRARWLVYAIMVDESKRLIRFLCELAGGHFVERPTMSPEEEMKRTREWLERNPALLSAWRDDVHGGRP